ncbi:M20 family metallopeptidase [Edaphobacter albus]|uniref:M20 family metallopeptidase n=1 Tax=Edaphobacter sp. 4G125 TaxID=2763071 RepID=UPI001645BA76|nr:M20 family metallopeptidase [Edaphobacter sp. 4G125]QNI36884.1 M20 family metallopeptidase [Edaphobacter sp. 4G125]
MNPQAILASTQTVLPWFLDHLEQLVRVESPSEDPAAINVAQELAAKWAVALGGRVKRHRQKKFGDVFELKFGELRSDPRSSKQKPILLLGHLDTVWPLGTLKSMPWREADGKIFGPGTLDMKAGVMMALAAVSVLRDLKLLRPITLLLNSEEEIGSPISRPITERLAKESSAVFVLEPAQGLALKTARKGVGHYDVHVTGVGAHSGVDFERGHSAVLELARQIERISGFTDLKRGLTVNCGVISGGTRSNVIAAEAHAEVDVRIARASDEKKVDRLFRSFKPIDPACKLTITGGINRPPMERKAGTIALFKRAKQLAADLGFDLEEASTGGGSDGNFTAALGIHTLDGMGAIGAGAHAAHEHIVKEHIVPRTALLAAMIATTP